MTIKHGYFASADPDAPTTYDQQTYARRRYFEQTDGVLQGVWDDLEVIPTDPQSLAISIGAGSVNIQGYWMESDEAERVNLAAADTSNPRIDRIVARLDTAVNMEISFAVLTGTPASGPLPPELTRTAYIYELSLAQVYVPAGATYVSEDNITDERRNTGVCGLTRARYGATPSGVVLPYAGLVVPPGWLLCDGESYSVSDFPELFATIGYTYGGSGDIFAVPNMTGRMPFGTAANHELGEIGGDETVALVTGEMPKHNHDVTIANGGNHAHTYNMGSGGTGSTMSLFGNVNYKPSTVTAQSGGILAGGVHTHTNTVSEVGEGAPHNNMPPYMALNFIIKS